MPGYKVSPRLRELARGSQEAEFSQPGAHLLVNSCRCQLTWVFLAAALVAAFLLPEGGHAALPAVLRRRGEAAGRDLLHCGGGSLSTIVCPVFRLN